MKNLFGKLFNRNTTDQNYIISEYKSIPENLRQSTPRYKGFEFELDEIETSEESDEMAIDNIYMDS